MSPSSLLPAVRKTTALALWRAPSAYPFLFRAAGKEIGATGSGRDGGKDALRLRETGEKLNGRAKTG